MPLTLCTALACLILVGQMASSSSIVPYSKRQRTSNESSLARSLLAQPNKTKTQLANTLQIMKDAGHLKEGMTTKKLTEASEHRSNQRTSYGNVVQKIKVDMPGLPYLDVCHLLVLLQYLCAISLSFGDMLYAAVQRAGGQSAPHSSLRGRDVPRESV